MIPGLSPVLGALSHLIRAAAELEQVVETTDESGAERTIEQLEVARVMIDDAIEELERESG